LTIQLVDSNIESVAIYNTLGQTIKVANTKTSTKQATLNVASLVKGLYMVKINTKDGKIITKRFVKK
jgi:hypothetical protein